MKNLCIVLCVFGLIPSAYASDREHASDQYFMDCIRSEYSRTGSRSSAIHMCDRQRLNLLQADDVTYEVLIAFYKSNISYPATIVIETLAIDDLHRMKKYMLEAAFQNKNAAYYIQKTFESLVNGDVNQALLAVSEAEYASERVDEQIFLNINAIDEIIDEK